MRASSVSSRATSWAAERLVRDTFMRAWFLVFGTLRASRDFIGRWAVWLPRIRGETGFSQPKEPYRGPDLHRHHPLSADLPTQPPARSFLSEFGPPPAAVVQAEAMERECALYVTETTSLPSLLLRTPGEIFAESWPERASTASAMNGLRFKRIYFGNELCARLMPSLTEVKHALDAARSMDWGFTLCTHTATDAALDAWSGLISNLLEFTKNTDDLEIVVNDFGLLRLLAKSQRDARLVLGRHMKRGLRDYRVASDPAPLAWTSEELDLFRAFDVVRVDLDTPPLGLSALHARTPLPAALHFPCGWSATGRICMTGSLAATPEAKFLPDIACRRECRHLSFELIPPDTTARVSALRSFPLTPADTGLSVFQKGTTVFYLPSQQALERTLGSIEGSSIDRIVLQPGLPI